MIMTRKKGRFITATIYMKFPNEPARLMSARARIYAKGSKGVVIRDGREVKKVGKRWIYYVR